MNDPLVTLTTDFGDDSPYVAAMKGVLLGVNPRARLIDLSHQIPPQNLRHAAFFLAAALPYFPPATLHVIVVDPGVGTERAVLHVEVAGQCLLVPDNGCWTWLPGSELAAVRRVSNPRFFRPEVSHTFHGRDIFAPVAGHLSAGVSPSEIGEPASEWVHLDRPTPAIGPHSIIGEVIFVDRFGNLITNISAAELPVPPTRVQLGRRTLPEGWRWVRTYGEADAGSLVVLVSSVGTIEIAEVQGNAAQRLRGTTGTAVEVVWDD